MFGIMVVPISPNDGDTKRQFIAVYNLTLNWHLTDRDYAYSIIDILKWDIILRQICNVFPDWSLLY